MCCAIKATSKLDFERACFELGHVFIDYFSLKAIPYETLKSVMLEQLVLIAV